MGIDIGDERLEVADGLISSINKLSWALIGVKFRFPEIDRF